MTPDPNVAKIQSSFRQLSKEASILNSASDEFTQAVGVLDKAIGKLNVGVAVWLNYAEWTDEDGGYGSAGIGYAKINGTWGIALRRVSGEHGFEQHESTTEWLFPDGPRETRLEAVDSLPQLVTLLSEAVAKAAQKVRAKAVDAKALAEAIGNLGDGREKTNIVAPGRK
jgi:hypothetical protein